MPTLFDAFVLFEQLHPWLQLGEADLSGSIRIHEFEHDHLLCLWVSVSGRPKDNGGEGKGTERDGALLVGVGAPMNGIEHLEL